MSYASDQLQRAIVERDLARQYAFEAVKALVSIATDESAPTKERRRAARSLAARIAVCRKCRTPLLWDTQFYQRKPIKEHENSCYVAFREGCSGRSPEAFGHRITICGDCVLSKARAYTKRSAATAHGRAVKLYNAALTRAKELSVDFDLDVDWIAAGIKAGCAVTSLTFELNPRGKCRQHWYAPSLDRKDPSLGYTKANVRVVVWIHNLAKSDWDDACVLRYAQALLRAKTTH